MNEIPKCRILTRRPALGHRHADRRSLSADDALRGRSRDSIGRRVRIAEPAMQRMRSTSEPSTSMDLDRVASEAVDRAAADGAATAQQV